MADQEGIVINRICRGRPLVSESAAMSRRLVQFIKTHADALLCFPKVAVVCNPAKEVWRIQLHGVVSGMLLSEPLACFIAAERPMMCHDFPVTLHGIL